MASIQTYLDRILSSRYGKDVRQSIHDAIEEVDRVADTAQGSATEAAAIAVNSAASAEQYRNETKQYRDEAEYFTPSGYTDLVEQVNENTFKIDTVIEKADLGIKNTTQGKQIHLVDSADAKIIESTLYGESQQKQYSGKNLWSHGNVSGTRYVTKNISLNADTYTISALVTSSDTDNTQSGIVCNYDDGSTVALHFNRNTRVAKTVTFTKSVVSMSLYASNNYANSTNDTFTWSNIQIEEGSTMTDYEPFVGNQPSPSPSYPQDIESVVVSEIKSICKNLQYNSATYDGWSKYNNGGTVTDETYNGGKVVKYTASWNFLYPPKRLFKAGTYTISFDAKVKASGTIHIGNVGGLGVNKSFESSPSDFSRYSYTFTLTEDKTGYIVPFIPSNSTVGELYIANIQVEEGSETPYEPYKESKVTLSAPITLRGIGDVKDVLCKQDGVYGVLRTIKKYEFTSIRAVLQNTNTVRYFADVTDFNGGNTSGMLCNVLSVKNIYQLDEVGLCAIPSSKVFIVRLPIDITEVNSTNEHLTWLQNNAELYYVSEPTFEPLSEVDNEQLENLSTFYPITNISNDGEGEMSVKYLCDSKNYVDNQLAEMEKAREQAMMEMFLLLPEETQAAMIENDVNNLLESEI